MPDIGGAAFSVFFMQSRPFLAHQRTQGEGRGRSNARTLLGMTALPGDNRIRQTLDGAPTDHFDAHGGLKAFRRLGGRVLMAMDGSEHHRSRKTLCAQCSTP